MLPESPPHPSHRVYMIHYSNAHTQRISLVDGKHTRLAFISKSTSSFYNRQSKCRVNRLSLTDSVHDGCVLSNALTKLRWDHCNQPFVLTWWTKEVKIRQKKFLMWFDPFIRPNSWERRTLLVPLSLFLTSVSRCCQCLDLIFQTPFNDWITPRLS